MQEFETLQCIVLLPCLFEIIQQFINDINKKLFTNKTDKKVMLDSFLRQIFICVHCLVLNKGNNLFIDTNAPLHYYRKFIQSIKTADRQKSIPAFAKELSITSVHLNWIYNQICGKPALLIIQEHFLELFHVTKVLVDKTKKKNVNGMLKEQYITVAVKQNGKMEQRLKLRRISFKTEEGKIYVCSSPIISPCR